MLEYHLFLKNYLNIHNTMSDKNEDVEELKKRNVELAKALEESKIAAAQRDREKLNLIRERNELKLKLNRIRSGGAAQIRQLDAALQDAIQETLTHLVQASNAVARTMELAKTYMRDRQELDASSPRWSMLSGTPVAAERERVNRVPPLLIGGQSIQPVVSLSRTLLNSSTSSTNRSPNQQNRNVTERAVPMHVLQDVYIPLTRIDAAELMGNQEEEEDEANNIENSTEDLGLDDSAEQELEESQNDNNAAFMSPQLLETVIEEEEQVSGDRTQSPATASRSCTDNPLEGPSWLLDVHQDTQTNGAESRVTLEPDSTTEQQEVENSASTSAVHKQQMNEVSPVVGGAAGAGGAAGGAFTPTVRRRKRTSSPHQPPSRRNSINKRVLKVVVAKMKFDDEEFSSSSPPKKMKLHSSPRPSPILQSLHQKPGKSAPAPAQDQPEDDVLSPILQMKVRPKVVIDSTKDLSRFDAPSPNGATDARVIIVSETNTTACGSGEVQPPRRRHNSARQLSDTSRDTDSDLATHTHTHTHATRRDTNKPRDTAASRRDTTTSRRDTSASRRDTDETRRDNSRSVTPESDGGVERQEGRSRRPRKQVVYREKPLNRKLRR
ncbi:PREDICTED: serine/arginine repetitive matrix protein 2-like isoform X1 [Papilio xuthus]|uniref:Serine/arginine repetitive matrix protein 2-like isoform X1 n=1 Tax=Papilio xuthus TaxID=66420 RepID=A0AAJ6ZX55_PAPXU|nr:PREDICTED: serine/arginine repetitive matrix protein 2-like isoform X1 [Papilio xuthus]